MKARQEAETKARSERIRKGVLGLWDKLTGEHAKQVKQGQMEAFFALQRDREQRQALLSAQIKDRQGLQGQIRLKREAHARDMLSLYRDAANFRDMQRGEPPSRPAASQSLESLWDKRLKEGRDLKAEVQGRERLSPSRNKGHDLER